jgi:membrane-associated phospholipid phosphatase
MKSGSTEVSNASRAAWAITCGLVLVDAALIVVQEFSIPPGSFAIVVGCTLLCLALSWFYKHVRPDEALRSLLATAAFLVAFSGAAACLSYLGASLSLPLRDALFADMDRALGFDWLSHLGFVADRPLLAAALTIAYHSCVAQLAVVLVVLAVQRNWARLAEFQFLVAASGATIIILAVLLPAVGAYVFHDPSGDIVARLGDPDVGRWHLGDFTALRDGTMREIPLRRAEGLVTFPSFHTALALVFTWSLVHNRWLALPMALLNGAMVISTLAIGGHYLIDVLAGGAIAFACILLVPALRADRAIQVIALKAPTSAQTRWAARSRQVRDV